MDLGVVILISIYLQGFEESEALLAILSDYQVSGHSVPTARLTYKFRPDTTPPVLG